MSQGKQIIEEIREIVGQYKSEVPGGRTAWPNSIKQRVLELRKQGMSYMAISRQTGIPYMTVLKWRDSGEDKFKEVSTVTVDKSLSYSLPNISTVTVTTSKGIKIEGLSMDQLFYLLERLE